MMWNSALTGQRKRDMQWKMSVDERRSVCLRRVRLRREEGEMCRRNDLTSERRPARDVSAVGMREKEIDTSAATISVERIGAAMRQVGKCLCTVWCEGGEFGVALGVSFPRTAVDIARRRDGCVNPRRDERCGCLLRELRLRNSREDGQGWATRC